MLSAIISTRDSERSLVRTLGALVPAVTTGLLREVIVADGGSKDATAEVADLAGCAFQASDAPLGVRLSDAARGAKGPWLLFLRAGAVPDENWLAAVEDFIAVPENRERAAAFAPAGKLAALGALIAGPHPEHGLLVARGTYEALGGHDGPDEAALLRKLGRRRIARLGARTLFRDT